MPFRRTTDDKVFAGVAGGLARSLEVDPVVVRIALVVAGVAVPTILVGYLAAWWLVPTDREPGRVHGPVVLKDGGVGFWVVAAILVGLLLGAMGDQLFLRFPLLGFNLFIPLAIIGIGVALWTRDGGPAATSPEAAAGPTAPPPPLAVDLPASPPPGPPARIRRGPRSRLGAVTLAVALMAAGVAAALDAGEVITVGATEVAAIAMLVLGLGLLVGSVFGRAKWVTIIAILLLPAVLFGPLLREAAADFDFDTNLGLGDGLGERNVQVVGEEDLPNDLRLLAGSIDLDLSVWTPDRAQLAAIDGDGADIVIEIGAGKAIVRLPDDVAWRVVANVGIGVVDLRDLSGRVVNSRSVDEFGTSLRVVHEGGSETGPVLDVQIEVALGNIDIRPAPGLPLSLTPSIAPTTHLVPLLSGREILTTTEQS